MFDILWSYTDQMLSHRLLKHLKKLILACDMAIWSWGNLRLTSGPWKEAKLNFPSKIFIYILILMFDPSKYFFWQTALIYGLKLASCDKPWFFEFWDTGSFSHPSYYKKQLSFSEFGHRMQKTPYQMQITFPTFLVLDSVYTRTIRVRHNSWKFYFS